MTLAVKPSLGLRDAFFPGILPTLADGISPRAKAGKKKGEAISFRTNVYVPESLEAFTDPSVFLSCLVLESEGNLLFLADNPR